MPPRIYPTVAETIEAHRLLMEEFGGLHGIRDKGLLESAVLDRKSTRLNSSHGYISYAVFCLKTETYELLRQMTPAEKRGQLSQYFYFRLPDGATADSGLGVEPPRLRRPVEDGLRVAGTGVLL